MPIDTLTSGFVANRLAEATYAEQFSDRYPPLGAHEAFFAADQCYFCDDAPCITACPLDIDVSSVIYGKPEMRCRCPRDVMWLLSVASKGVRISTDAALRAVIGNGVW